MTELHDRSVAFTLERAEAEGDGLTLTGYAAVFNTPAAIRDHLGEYDEVISPGAFKRTIAGGRPVLQFDHGQHPVLGSIPIGSIRSLREDTRGLFVEARIFDNWMTQPLRQAIDGGAIDGMSFRFSVPDGKDKWSKQDNGRELRTVSEVKLAELGPVVWPAYRETEVALRSLAEHVPGLRYDEPEPETTEVNISVAGIDPEVVARAIQLVLEQTSATPGTSEEPAAERSTSDEPAAAPDPAPASHSVPLDHSQAARKAFVRREIVAARMGAGKK
jgi:HK97 family phage prohead protease